jgi:hypothetical protein
MRGTNHSILSGLPSCASPMGRPKRPTTLRPARTPRQGAIAGASLLPCPARPAGLLAPRATRATRLAAVRLWNTTGFTGNEPVCLSPVRPAIGVPGAAEPDIGDPAPTHSTSAGTGRIRATRAIRPGYPRLHRTYDYKQGDSLNLFDITEAGHAPAIRQVGSVLCV